MYLVHTNIVIWIIRGATKYVSWFDQLKSGNVLTISTITIAEIYKNVFQSELLNTQEVINEFSLYDVTANIAKQAGFYWQQFSKKYKNLNILDCIIAATAKEHNLRLLTLNTRHFPMDDIKVIDPGKK